MSFSRPSVPAAVAERMLQDVLRGRPGGLAGLEKRRGLMGHQGLVL